MKTQMKVVGLKDLNQNLAKIVRKVVDPQSGISDSLEKGLWRVVNEARSNVWEAFNTSGDFPKRIRPQKINQYRVDVVVNAVYAAVHEYGGTFTVTERQRGFFWAKWYQSGDPMWKALALSATYTIPPRPYLRPAIDSKQREAIEVAARDLFVKIQRAT